MNTTMKNRSKDEAHSCKLLFIQLNLAALLLLPTVLMADIYKSVGNDGIISFTDRPTSKNATLVLKTERKQEVRQNRPPDRVKKQSQLQPELVPGAGIQSNQVTDDKPDSRPESVSPLADGVITSGVGVRVDPIDGLLRQHNGIDIAVPEGTRINSVADGTITFAGTRSGYGLTVIINHGDNLVTIYGHNSKLTVEAGQSIRRGEQVAFSGNTGRSTGPHLHFEAWQDDNNISASFIPGRPVNRVSLPEVVRHTNRYRKDLLADGSILITNLPFTRIK